MVLSKTRFRWVALELEIFLPQSRRQGSRVRPADFEGRLRMLERSRAPAVDRLFLAYDQIYLDALGEEYEVSRRQIVNVTMKWVLCAFRPFDVAELITVVSSSLVVSQAKIDDAKDGDDDSKTTLPNEFSDIDPVSGEDLLTYCANFITTTKEGIVRLAHLSVRQYFEKTKAEEFNPPQQHLEAAVFSIRTLSGQFEGRDSTSLADYLSKLWPIHARIAKTSPELDLLLTSDKLLMHFEADDVKLKIALRNDLQECDCLGNTILHDAVLNGSRDDVELILQVHTLFQQSSPLVNKRNFSGDTPLHVAASRGFETLFIALIHAGSSFNEQNELGLTPLHVAILFGQENIVRAASQFIWGLDAPDGTGSTPLHTSALCNAVEIGRALISAGASTSQKDLVNRTASDVSREFQRFEFTAMLNGHAASDQTLVDKNQSHSSEARILARPRIYIESTSTCRYCNIEEWLEGSRQGLRYPHCPSITALERSADSCSLCRYLCTSIRKQAYAKEAVYSSEAESTDITVSVALAADSKNGLASQDLLSVYHGRTLVGQLEFCVDGVGKFWSC